MKTWTIPVATAQQFAANEYVSACFKMSCEAWSPFMEEIGMEDGTGCFIDNLYADTNGNGQWDGKDVDNLIISGPVTCGAEMEDHIVGDANKPNCFIVFNDGVAHPAYTWSDSTGDHVGQMGKATVDLGNMS